MLQGHQDGKSLGTRGHFLPKDSGFKASAAALVYQASPWINQVQSFYCGPQF